MNIQQKYKRVARIYNLLDWPFEWIWYKQWRQLALHRVKGTVLELGVGTGKNLRYYDSANRLFTIDLTLNMLTQAISAATDLNLKPAFTQSHTLHLPFANQHFDWVVATFVLYIVPDIQRTLAEIARVLKPGGRLLFFEFYFSETHNRNPIIRWALNLFTLIYGPNFYRRTSAYLHEAGFEMQQRTGLATNGIAELVMASHNRSGSSGFYGVSRRVMSDE